MPEARLDQFRDGYAQLSPEAREAFRDAALAPWTRLQARLGARGHGLGPDPVATIFAGRFPRETTPGL
jgi:hypothetical protein